MEAFTLGVVTAFYDNVIVLQALLITTGIFLGLTLFTLQSKVGHQSSALRCMFDNVGFSMTSPAWARGYSVAFSPWVSFGPMLPWSLDLIPT
jgi:FtsH-binding integral membrane protein